MLTDIGVQLGVALVSGVILLYLGILIAKKRRLRRPHNIRTSVFGLQFMQDGERQPVVHDRGFDRVLLSPAPFDVLLDRNVAKKFGENVSLCVAVFASDKIWKNANTAEPIPGYFSSGLSLIDRDFGSGILPLARFTMSDDLFSYILISEDRFNSSNETQLGFFVSAITPESAGYFEVKDGIATSKARDPNQANLIQRGARLHAIIALKADTPQKRKALMHRYEKLLLCF